MGILSKLCSSFKSNGTYGIEAELPLRNTSQLATYLVPGSAVVQVDGASTAVTVSSLQQGDKILSVAIGKDLKDSVLNWATLQHMEAVGLPANSNLRTTISVGLEGNDSVLLKADQVVLATDHKSKLAMQSPRQLCVGYGSVIAFSPDTFRRRGKRHEMKKVKELRLVREMEPSDCSEYFYKLTVGSTDHGLLMSCSQDSTNFVVANPSNSTWKSTMLEGIRRSRTDTDVYKPAVRNDKNKPRTVPASAFANADHALGLNTGNNVMGALSRIDENAPVGEFGVRLTTSCLQHRDPNTLGNERRGKRKKNVEEKGMTLTVHM